MTYGQDEQKRLANLLIDNLTDNDELKQRLPGIGMDIPATLAEGQRLYAEAETLISVQNKLTAKVNRIWDVIHAKHAPAWSTYCLHRGRALTVLQQRPDLRTLLGIPRRLAVTRPTQLNQMRPFYPAALDSPAALELLAEVALTAPKLAEAYAAVAELERLERRALRWEAEKQAATASQDRALELLNAWRINGWKRINLVTEDAPHLRKALGMTIATGRPRKRRAADPTSPADPDGAAQDVASPNAPQ